MTALNHRIVKVSGPGTAPQLTACHSLLANAVFLRTYSSADSEDIVGNGVTPETVLEIETAIPNGETAFNTIIVGWASKAVYSGGLLTITASPRPWSFAGNGLCVPDNCNVETAQQTWQSYLMAQVNLPNPLTADINRTLAGAWVSTGANAFGVMPAFVTEGGADCTTPSAACAPSMKIRLAGPHRQTDGALNRAYFRAFLPSNLLNTFMGGASASALDLIRREAGAGTGSEISGMQCDPDTGGILCTYDDPNAHFSAPTYAIRKATAAAPASPAATPTTPAAASVPLSKVRSATAKATKRSVRITWTAPAGAAATQRYLVALRNKKKSVSRTVAGTSVTFRNLAKGIWKGSVTPVAGAGSLDGASTSVSVRVK